MAELRLESNESECVLMLIARDGVFQYTPYLALSRVILAQGTRSDVAIRCARPGTVVFSIHLAMGGVLGRLFPFDQSNVFSVVVSPAATSSLTPRPNFPSSQAPLPSYLRSLTDARVSMGGQNVTNIILAQHLLDNSMRINNVAFPGFHSNVYIDRLCVNNVYEYTSNPPKDISQALKRGAKRYRRRKKKREREKEERKEKRREPMWNLFPSHPILITNTSITSKYKTIKTQQEK
eukprot:TRINITY_DN2433_c0_g3_i1.p1 TRINITY_DN2433_c0_g3~~TRINITY_DN2433_c0_g3_i1.p1  ORF type:complete len:235 (+),score=56.89 TRINITY_DN2433_c0_g3_i1:1050-1754(+)